MSENKRSDYIISGLLKIILVVLMVGILQSMYAYYTGPSRVARQYVAHLAKGEYDKVYSLLETTSTKAIGSKEEIVAYYHKTYKQNRTFSKKKLDLKVISENEGIATYNYQVDSLQGTLTLQKVKHSWEVVFPFTPVKVEVYAPYDARVYLNEIPLTKESDQWFVKDKVLPGNYVVRIELPHKDYKDYYTTIRVPEETRISVPYELVDVEIEVPSGLQISLDDFGAKSNGEVIRFNKILPGNYTFKVIDPLGCLEPIHYEVSIQNKETTLTAKNFALSDKGEEKFETFMNQFYISYLEGIKKQDENAIANYLEGEQTEEMLRVYGEWFIENKDIKDASVTRSCSTPYVDETGTVCTTVTENILLSNLEEDLLGEAVSQKYKLTLKWETKMDLMQKDWLIKERNLIESMVAYLDDENRWVQY